MLRFKLGKIWTRYVHMIQRVSYVINASILIPIQQKSSETKAKTQQKTTNIVKDPQNIKPTFEKPTTPTSGFKKPNNHVSTYEPKMKPAEQK